MSILPRAAAGVVALLVALPPAAAGAVAASWNVNQATVWTSGAIDRVVGWEFAVSSPAQLTEIGVFDATPQNSPNLGFLGLGSPHAVGVFSAAGALLTNSVVPAGQVAPLAPDGYRYVNVAPLNLAPGAVYTVAALWPGGTWPQNPSFDVQPDLSQGFLLPPPAVTYASPVSYLRGRIGLTSNLVFPTIVADYAPNINVGAVNFRFIPEPSALTGLALLAALLRRRRG